MKFAYAKIPTAELAHCDGDESPARHSNRSAATLFK